jgi:hypothetical protein
MKANFFTKRQSSIQGLIHFSAHRKDHSNELKEHAYMSSAMSCFLLHTDALSEEKLQLRFAKIQISLHRETVFN